MKFRYVLIITLVLISLLSLAILLANQYVQFLPNEVSSSIVLWVGAISIAVAFLSQLKDVIELGEKLLSRMSIHGKPNKTITPCDTPVIHGFGEVWYREPSVRNILGCPPTQEDIEKETHVTFQSFQHGEMIALTLDSNGTRDVVYILFQDNNTFQRLEVQLHTFDIEQLERTYKSDFRIDPKFAGIYWRMTGSHIKQRLGNPTASSRNSYGACQQFESGRMVWIQTTNDIYALLEYADNSNKHKEWKKYRNVTWWDYKK